MNEIPETSSEGKHSTIRERLLGGIVFLQFIGGTFLFYIGLLAFSDGTFFGSIAGMSMWVLGIVYYIVGFALFFTKSWAWMMAIISNVLGLILYMYQLPLTVIGLILNLVILLYLNQTNIRNRFR